MSNHRFALSRAAGVIAILVILPACSGPGSPFSIGVKRVATDVSLGGQAGIEPQPEVISDRGSTFPGFIQAPQPPPRQRGTVSGASRRGAAAPGRGSATATGKQPGSVPAGVPPGPGEAPPGSQNPGQGSGTSSPPPPVFVPCSPAGSSSSTLTTTGTVVGAPSPATYVFRNDGSFGKFRSQRVVKNVTKTADGSVFDVESLQTGNNSTTTYQVKVDGLYIVRIVTPGRTFTAVPPLLLLPLPVVTTPQPPSWRAEAVNPGTPLRMSYDARVVGRASVDACGTWIEGWQVQVSNGKTSGIGPETSFSAEYVIANQFGGISVGDSLASREGTSQPTQNTAIINEVPKASF